MNRSGVRASVLYLLLFCSGVAGLGYQVAWIKMFATGLGHELPAALAVVSAFMGGMGLGAWALDKPISRSASPGRWYAMLESVIGGWAFLSTLLIPLANQAAPALIGADPSEIRHWTIAFLLPFLTLLPATCAMGATLPAMERFVAPVTPAGRCVGGVYAANTLGAVAGALLSAFVIVPAFGLRGSVWCFGAINLICAAAAFVIVRRHARKSVDGIGRLGETRGATSLTSRRLGITLCATGLLGIAYETAGLKVLSEILENTVYTFATVLSIFLLGTAGGAGLYQRFSLRWRSGLLLSDLLGGLSMACMGGVFALSRAQPIYEHCRSALGDSVCGVLLAELAVAGLVFGLPTVLMGAVFSHLAQSARREEGGVGRALALNTFGGALAPALFGVFLLPAIGSKWTLVCIAAGYLFLLPKVAGWGWGLLAAPLVLLLTLPANLHVVQIPPGGSLAEYREGVMASVAVIKEAGGDKILRVNNRFQMGGTAAAEAEYRHAHIPLLLHPAPKRALFLGLGTGISFGAATLYPDLQSDGVELVPEVVGVMSQFEPYNFAPEHHAALKMYVADARRFIRATDARYDVIVADLFHPARDGAGSLYTVEHFRAARQRLAPGGLFCQWLPLYQLDESMLRIIVRSFLEVFPEADAWLLRLNVDAPVIGLMGALEWPEYSPGWIEKRAAAHQLGEHLKKLALADSIRFFGSLIAGPNELRGFSGDAPLNTDDQPRITFGAPRFAYQKHTDSYGRLVSLLGHGISNVHDALHLGPDVEASRFANRVGDYMKARDVYLNGLIEQTEGRPERALDLFVESARLSEDFTAGYAQCLTIASLEAKSSPAKARALLQRLAAAQPARPVARQLLERLPAK